MKEVKGRYIEYFFDTDLRILSIFIRIKMFLLYLGIHSIRTYLRIILQIKLEFGFRMIRVKNVCIYLYLDKMDGNQ